MRARGFFARLRVVFAVGSRAFFDAPAMARQSDALGILPACDIHFAVVSRLVHRRQYY